MLVMPVQPNSIANLTTNLPPPRPSTITRTTTGWLTRRLHKELRQLGIICKALRPLHQLCASLTGVIWVVQQHNTVG